MTVVQVNASAIALPSPRAVTAWSWRDALSAPHRYRSAMWPPGSLAAVGAARRFAADALAEWQRGELTDAVTVCVSELVTNALVHAAKPHGGVRLGLRRFPGCCLVVEVWDGDPTVPCPPPPVPDPAASPLWDEPDIDAFALGGRGLLIVRQESDCFWWSAGLTGKTACARFDFEQGKGAKCQVI